MSERVRAMCDVPPKGWACTRAAGHEGPCAAIEVGNRHSMKARLLQVIRERFFPGEFKEPFKW